MRSAWRRGAGGGRGRGAGADVGRCVRLKLAAYAGGVRIIAGQFRSRTLVAPPGLSTRPMPDRVKESIFGMLGERVVDAQVADLFAGSGSLGLEALSRGARRAVFFDKDRAACAAIDRNIASLGVSGRAALVEGDALGGSVPLRCPRPSDLIFIDPPYPLVRTGAGWDRVREQCTLLAGVLADDGFLLLRTPWPFVIEAAGGGDASEAPDGGAGGARPTRARRGSPRVGPGAGGARGGRGGYKSRRGKGGRNLVQDLGPDGETIEWIARIDRGGIDPAALAGGRDESDADADAAAGDQPGDDDGVRVAEPPTGEPRLVGGGGVAGDLRIAGLRGPETHPYGKTAVHWYMRAR